MTWVAAVPTAVLLLAVVFVPGWVYLRVLGTRGLVALAAAPAVTVGVLGALSVGYGAAGLAWTMPTVLAGLLLVGVLVVAVGRLLSGTAPARRPVARLGGGAAGIVAAGVLAGLALVTGVFAAAIGSPDAVPQMHDSLFHLNGAELVTQTGQVTPFGSMAGLYGEGVGSGFYPTAWHALVVLGADVGGVVPATNALLVVGVFLPWLTGIAALGHVAAPRLPLVAALGPVLASAAVVFPTVAVAFKGMYPFGLSVALTPGTLALAASVLPGVVPRRAQTALAARPRLWGGLGPWLAVAAAAAGVVLAHSSGLAALGFLGAPILVTSCWRAGRRHRARGRRALGWFVALAPAAVLGLLVLAVYTVPRLRAMAGYPSPEGDPVAALRHVLLGSTPEEPAAALAVSVLMILGLVVAGLEARWLAVSWLVALVLFVAAAGPDGTLRTLTGFWYKSPDRLESLLVTLSAVLAAWGAVALGRVASRVLARGGRDHRAGEVLAGVVAVAAVVVAAVTSGTFNAEERQARTASAYRPDEMVHPPWATYEELDFIRDLDDVLPADAVVVGDPMSGAAFVQVLAERRAYIPILGESALSHDQEYLQENFHDVGRDPRVCEILEDDGVEFFYEDVSVPYGPRQLADIRPGFYGVDVASGFEPLASSGTATLYRIVACD